MKRVVLAIILTLLFITIVGLLSLPSFAAPQSGDTCTTDYLDTLVGSDGGYFYRSGAQTSIKYYSDGTSGTFLHENYDGPRKHSVIIPKGQASYYGYCIEQGVSFPDAQQYQGVGWENDSYFSHLPKSTQAGIMLATIFGRQPGKSVPVAGCNDDDWYWATQVIIWEYQQQLRLSPTNIHGNGYVAANYFLSTLDGRPAEKCYNYILNAMAQYQRIPSFTTNTSTDAPTNILKWDSTKLQWRLTINDTNMIGYPIISDDPTLKIEQSGNSYTFVSTMKFDLKTIKFRKNITLPSHEMLIWGGVNKTQAIATGTADPVQFFAGFRTEQPGTIEILKTSEDGEKKGFMFQLTDQSGQITSLATNDEGIATAQLFPGEYLVSEQESQKYRLQENIKIQIRENEKTSLEVVNILKKGQVRIQKKVIDTMANDSKYELGAVFQIFPEDYATFESVPENLRDEITTNALGTCISKPLPLGNYTVRQTIAGSNITISPDSSIKIQEDLQTVLLTVDNLYQKGKIQVLKANTSKIPLAGAVFTIRAAEDILLADGTIKYEADRLIDTLITDDDGWVSTDWLYPGEYNIEEIRAPNGYILPKNPITSVLLMSEDPTELTFIKHFTIVNNSVEEFPNTGDDSRREKSRIAAIMLLMSLIGIGLLIYSLREQNKTLH